ncbi:MAG: formate dehydrogenase accessory sulfurtransferase FdhD [Myxococcota bacterium]
MSFPSDRTTLAGIARSEVVRVRGGSSETIDDAIAVEEPLEIRIADERWATIMRTPGSDHELVAGLLLAEGIITSSRDVVSIAPCRREGSDLGENVIAVQLAPGVLLDEHEASRRRSLATAACGVCGRSTIDDLLARLKPLSQSTVFDSAWLAGLPGALTGAQRNFSHTGGLHAAAVAHPERGLLALREDIGRHNAVDKVVGRLLLDGDLPAHGAALVVSGRAGFEIVQKAWVAGIGALVSVSAPSSLAVGTAVRSKMLLLGFAREGNFNVYAGGERLRGLGGRGI